MNNSTPMAIRSLEGYISALPTPFRDGAIDAAAFDELCEWQIEQGIAGLVVGGTTGEAPTLSMTEMRHLVRRAVHRARGRVPIIAGTGSNATSHAIDLAAQAEDEGADCLLVVTPYYNRPSQEGVFRHYQAIRCATALPLILYDVPSRTGMSLTDETILRLAALPRIIGLKDATGDLLRVRRLRRHLGPDFRLLSGDDATAIDFMIGGGNGCISVASNVVPSLCAQLYAAQVCGRSVEVRKLTQALAPLIVALSVESNPVPVKAALGMMGRLFPEFRLPLCEPSEATCHLVRKALRCLDLLPSEVVVPLAASGKRRLTIKT